MKKTFGSDKPRRFAPSGDKKFGGKPAFGPKKKFGEDRPRGPVGSTGRRPDGDKPAWKSDKPAFNSDRPAWKSDRPGGGDKPRYSDSSGSGERRPYGDKPSWKSDKPAFKSDRPAWKSDRPGGGDKPRYSDSSGSGERRPYGDKPAWKSDKPAYNSARPAWKSDRPGGGDKPRYSDSSGSGERRPYGDKPSWKSDKPAFKSDRPAWKSDRPGGGDKPRFSDSSGSGERRSYGDKPAWKSDKPAYNSDRPAWKSDRPGGSDKPRYSDSSGSGERRPYGEKPAWKSDKPAYNSDRPAWKSDRPGGSDKPRYSDSSGSGERRPYGDKPAWKSDKPAFNSDRPAWKTERPEVDRIRPVWKPEGPMDPDRPARDPAVSVPFNKKNFDESSSRPDFAGKTFSKGSRPTYNPQTDAKSLIVTLDDTHNVPVRLVWIYDTMVGELPDGEPSAGDTVFVYDHNNRFAGSAIYNPNSRIRARIFSLTRRKFDEAYLREAIEKAISTRKQLGLLNESCRAISGEGDGIPGLIADKIGDYLVVQPLTYAVNRHLAYIIDQLNSQLAPTGIVVRKDVPIRAKEGLSVEEPTIHGEVPERVKVVEEGCIMFANPAGGQKTGLFLDQRLNRAVLKPFSKDARVLDLFCHVGGWAMRAAKYGAAEVIGVDSSESALELATSGAKANGFDKVSFVEDDVFEYLRKLDSEPENLFDIIICDPPAFAKTRSHYEEAFRAYLSLNYLVMKRLKPGGLLITCSCSQAVSSNEFNEAILTSARNARMQFQVIEKRGAPQDHPVLLGLPESEYLKCFVMRRID